MEKPPSTLLPIIALVILAPLASAQDDHRVSVLLRYLGDNHDLIEQRAEAFEQAANQLEIQGRALSPVEQAQAAWYRHRAAALTEALNTLAELDKSHALDEEKLNCLIRAAEILRGPDTAPAEPGLPGPFKDDFPGDGAPEKLGSPFAPSPDDLAANLREARRRIQVLELQQGMAQLRAEEAKLTLRMAKVRLELMQLQLRLRELVDQREESAPHSER